MTSDGMATTVRTLADAEAEIAKLKAELDEVQAECDGAWQEVDQWEAVARNASHADDELRTVREFIADVRLGIRDLSEYEDVCGS